MARIERQERCRRRCLQEYEFADYPWRRMLVGNYSCAAVSTLSDKCLEYFSDHALCIAEAVLALTFAFIDWHRRSLLWCPPPHAL